MLFRSAGTGGAVTVGTVTAQLLYEIGGAAYANPDATARFDTIRLTQDGPDRVRIDGVRGELPPERLKVAATYLGGFRNSMTLVMTGLDAGAKADLALRTVTGLGLVEATDPAASSTRLAQRSRLSVRDLIVDWMPAEGDDPSTTDQAQSLLRITVRDMDPKAVGKPFTTSVVESALASYPGMFPTAPPEDGSPYGVYWPTTIARDAAMATVHVDGGQRRIPVRWPEGAGPQVTSPASPVAPVGTGPVIAVPLGRLIGARSGDKGGDANIGVWVPAAVPDEAYAWIVNFLTEDRVRELLPEAALLPIDIHQLPNLRAVNIVIHGLLGRGVSENTRSDPQAKGLGEHLRARIVEKIGRAHV